MAQLTFGSVQVKVQGEWTHWQDAATESEAIVLEAEARRHGDQARIVTSVRWADGTESPALDPEEFESL